MYIGNIDAMFFMPIKQLEFECEKGNMDVN